MLLRARFEKAHGEASAPWAVRDMMLFRIFSAEFRRFRQIISSSRAREMACDLLMTPSFS